MQAIDVGYVIDEGQWTTYQKLLILATALTIILDGVDNQLLGNAIPSLMKEWSLSRSAFSTVLALSPLGMMFGGALGGMLGDRIGRRSALLGSVISFAALTLAASTVNGLLLLGVLRFLAGLGLGGAMPNAAALSSEYAPRRQRPFAVTLTIVCIPLGGTLAAILSANVLPIYGWRMLFVLGGIIPIALGLILLKCLPESPSYLAARRERWPELIVLLRKLGHSVSSDAEFVEAHAREAQARAERKGDSPKPQMKRAALNIGTSKSRASMSALFLPEFRRDTLGLFGSFFFCLLANYVGILLLVATLTGAGFTQAGASNALGWWNIGGVAGAVLGALLIQRFGSRMTMLGVSGLAIASAFIVAATPLDPRSTFLILMLILLGGTLNAVQTTMYALAAHVYPTEIRSTGIGTAVAVGRIGNVLASYTGNFALDAGGPAAYFSSFGIAMMLVFGSLAVIRRHISVTLTEIAAAKIGATAGH